MRINDLLNEEPTLVHQLGLRRPNNRVPEPQPSRPLNMPEPHVEVIPTNPHTELPYLGDPNRIEPMQPAQQPMQPMPEFEPKQPRFNKHQRLDLDWKPPEGFGDWHPIDQYAWRLLNRGKEVHNMWLDAEKMPYGPKREALEQKYNMLYQKLDPERLEFIHDPEVRKHFGWGMDDMTDEPKELEI